MDKVTLPSFQEKKKRGEKITMLTAYDLPFARLIDEAGVDAVLVGDSLGMVALGYPTTVPVTMEEMIHHAKAVRRGVSRALLVGDMPFMSFNLSVKETVRNASRFLKEAGCDAVKVEGGQGSLDSLEAVQAILDAGIPVLGHLGLTPQTAGKTGGFRVQAKTAPAARKLLAAAEELESSGCFGIVLECVPSQVADLITRSVSIPTIGIGAGNRCDGQVLVTHDLLNLSGPFHPKFARAFARLDAAALKAVKGFRKAVEERSFPSREESYEMPPDEWERLRRSA
ncbi:MAG: 3-methyl-2-oxobutanoate hydroxymethyltransferase [Candidatus Omnitrophica bacterium]|nr:3-methyl-2-oxobutanoate hydroxymethyltransferase [Candidatus Omnitrophota bacterium]